jgi:hypothetical protein
MPLDKTVSCSGRGDDEVGINPAAFMLPIFCAKVRGIATEPWTWLTKGGFGIPNSASFC